MKTIFVENKNRLLLLLAAFSIAACDGAGTDNIHDNSQEVKVPLRELWGSNQCGGDGVGESVVDGSTVIIREKSALDAWWKSLNNTVLPTPPLPQSLQALNFKGESMIVFYMGERPTTGYGLELAKHNASLSQEAVLSLPLKSIAPPADSIQPQVMTSPCLAIAAPAQFERVNTLIQ